jgi:hypothetical protein
MTAKPRDQPVDLRPGEPKSIGRSLDGRSARAIGQGRSAHNRFPEHGLQLSGYMKWVPPQSPCKFSRPSPVKMLNSLRYLVFGLGRCDVVMEPASRS